MASSSYRPVAILTLSGLASLSVLGCAELGEPAPKPRKTAQQKWDQRVGQTWETYASNFEQGYGNACDGLFDADTRSLYSDGVEWTSNDCLGADTSEPDSAAYVDIPDSPPDEIDLEWQGGLDGAENACNAMFATAGVDVLSWGTERFTVEDCMAIYDAL
jgi:hypothetical protein